MRRVSARRVGVDDRGWDVQRRSENKKRQIRDFVEKEEDEREENKKAMGPCMAFLLFLFSQTAPTRLSPTCKLAQCHV